MRRRQSPHVTAGPDTSQSAAPIRTCVGCRRAEVLSVRHLRVVFDGQSAIVPDWQRKLPGRGAWVHRDRECLQLAVDRKAFARALKVRMDTDVSALQELAAYNGIDDPLCIGAGEEENSNGPQPMSKP